MSPIKEIGQTTRSFFDALKDQPLSIALVVMNFAMMAFLFYIGHSTQEYRKEATKMIISWSEATDQLMAQCVSKEIMQMVLEALKPRDNPNNPINGFKLQSGETRPAEID